MVTHCRGVKTATDLLHIPEFTIDAFFHRTYGETFTEFIRTYVENYQEPQQQTLPNRVPDVALNSVLTMHHAPEGHAKSSMHVKYIHLKKQELVVLLKERKLPISGTKEVQISRLVKHDSLSGSSLTEPASRDPLQPTSSNQTRVPQKRIADTSGSSTPR